VYAGSIPTPASNRPYEQLLGSMKNARIHASVDEIAKSLHGNWRAEHLFALKQALAAFDFVAPS
jgi:hypothetical protein